MRLQLRIRHALGARMLEIEPRGADRPIVVGRSAEADVQVPIGTVAPSHCVLYMEGDQWVIQDVGSSTGTYVNGGEISGPVYLNLGDVVSLGEGAAPPVIEIDPMGTARRQGLGVKVAARPVRRVQPSAAEEEKPVVEEDKWAGLGGGPVAYRSVGRPRRPGSYVGVTIFLTILVIVAGWIVVARVMKEDPPEVIEQPMVKETRIAGVGKKAPVEDRSVVVAPIAVPVPAPIAVEQNRAEKISDDPAKLTEEWKAVVEANAPSDRPGKALWTIVDYRRLHPGKFEGELKQFEDVALDRLWWERIGELMELRASDQADIARKNVEITQESNAEFREKLQKERQVLEDRKKAVGEVLAGEMGYARQEIPNLFDAEEMGRLRGERNGQMYEVWKKRVILSLQRTRKLPWESR